MDRALVSLVWQRAHASCEYCLLPQSFSSMPFEIDHIIAEKQGVFPPGKLGKRLRTK